MGIEFVELGSSPTGAGGDNLRQAFGKVNASLTFLDEKEPSVAEGIPPGGDTGQVLKKVSGDDFDVEWAEESGEPGEPGPPGEDARTEAVNLLDVATGSPLSYELQEGDTGTVFALYAEAGVTVVVPDTLPPGFTCGFVGFSLDGLTLDYDGWGPPVGWLAGAAAFANVPFAVTLAITEGESPFSALVLVGGSAKPDTVTVVYDSGWPVARPYATHVIAIGHSSAPSWLTSADVWLEAV